MSDDSHRTKSKSEILSELDRLKALLDQDRFENGDDIPLLDEVVDIDDAMAAESPATKAEESAAKTNGATGKTPAGELPTREELNKLIEMLVTHQLRRMRPVVQKEVMRLLLERYPKLK